MNYLQVIYFGAEYGCAAYKQMRFIKKFLNPIVDKLCSQLDYQLTAREKQKVTYYYPLFNHIVNCENYLIVKGRKLNIDESKRLAIISVMATLYDDLIDEERWDKEQLFAVFNRTMPKEDQTKKVKLIFALDDELKKIWQPTQKYLDALRLSIEWQLISSKQLQPTISLDEVLDISKQKCGNSSLLWASIMDENWNENDTTFIYQSGFVGQLVNDLMDAFKDREDGVKTFVFASSSIKEAKEIFLKECSKLHQLVLICDAPESFRIKTIRRMAGIHAFGLVSLEHLQKAESRYGNLAKATRKDLVTDMAFWSNKIKLLKYASWLAKLR